MQQSGADAPGEVRIVAGTWRGRKVRFPAAEGLRPTPDRVRETVFNWLQFDIAGRRCLDLFAGSGALGLEALSRGAASVVFVERDAAAAKSIAATLQEFGSTSGRVERCDALTFLQTGHAQPFDIVFLDPPYAERLLEPACSLLEARGWLSHYALVYLEDAAERGEPSLPAGFTLLRSKRAGDVGYHLARRGAPQNNDSND